MRRLVTVLATMGPRITAACPFWALAEKPYDISFTFACWSGCMSVSLRGDFVTLGLSRATIVGRDGPCRSASKMPTLPPRRVIA